MNNADIPDLATQLRAALWSWRRNDGRMLRGLILVDRYVLAGHTESDATMQVIQDALEVLKHEAPAHAKFLDKRFGKGLGMAALTLNEAHSERALYLRQREAIDHLARVILNQEKQLNRERRRLLANLPTAPHTTLIGGQEKMASLLPMLSETNHSPIFVLSGMGGIGKTSLANALVRTLVVTGVYDRFGWVSAQQATFSLGGRIITLSDRPALTLETLVQSLAVQLLDNLPSSPLPHHELREVVLRHLLAHPHLIVIDNLETVPDVNHLLPFLRQAASTTKVLLTSRVQLLDEGDVFHYVVPSLRLEEATELLQQEAHARNLPVLLELNQQAVERIYEVVGGNPLALRLVAGQIHCHGLDAVLEDLRTTGGMGEQLSNYLFEWTWDSLSDLSRAVFLAMPLIPDTGGTLVDLVNITEFPVSTVRRALQELVERNLVNVQGDAVQRTYSVHNLTRVFLQERVAQWI